MKQLFVFEVFRRFGLEISRNNENRKDQREKNNKYKIANKMTHTHRQTHANTRTHALQTH
jgi:hypothetical protein